MQYSHKTIEILDNIRANGSIVANQSYPPFYLHMNILINLPVYLLILFLRCFQIYPISCRSFISRCNEKECSSYQKVHLKVFVFRNKSNNFKDYICKVVETSLKQQDSQSRLFMRTLTAKKTPLSSFQSDNQQSHPRFN